MAGNFIIIKSVICLTDVCLCVTLDVIYITLLLHVSQHGPVITLRPYGNVGHVQACLCKLCPSGVSITYY